MIETLDILSNLTLDGLICDTCGKTLDKDRLEARYCDKSCANTPAMSEEWVAFWKGKVANGYEVPAELVADAMLDGKPAKALRSLAWRKAVLDTEATT